MKVYETDIANNLYLTIKYQSKFKGEKEKILLGKFETDSFLEDPLILDKISKYKEISKLIGDELFNYKEFEEEYGTEMAKIADMFPQDEDIKMSVEQIYLTWYTGSKQIIYQY